MQLATVLHDISILFLVATVAPSEPDALKVFPFVKCTSMIFAFALAKRGNLNVGNALQLPRKKKNKQQANVEEAGKEKQKEREAAATKLQDAAINCRTQCSLRPDQDQIRPSEQSDRQTDEQPEEHGSCKRKRDRERERNQRRRGTCIGERKSQRQKGLTSSWHQISCICE